MSRTHFGKRTFAESSPLLESPSQQLRQQNYHQMFIRSAAVNARQTVHVGGSAVHHHKHNGPTFPRQPRIFLGSVRSEWGSDCGALGRGKSYLPPSGLLEASGLPIHCPVQLDPLRLNTPVSGDQQVFDVELDRSTELLPTVTDRQPAGWEVLTIPLSSVEQDGSSEMTGPAFNGSPNDTLEDQNGHQTSPGPFLLDHLSLVSLNTDLGFLSHRFANQLALNRI